MPGGKSLPGEVVATCMGQIFLYYFGPLTLLVLLLAPGSVLDIPTANEVRTCWTWIGPVV